MRCNCGSEAFQKFGSYHRNGNRIQRLKCKQCDAVCSDTTHRPLLNLRVPLERAVLIVHLLCEGNGVRGASRITGLHQQTILNVLEVAGAKCGKLLDERISGLTSENLEVDELYSYVRTRPEHANRSSTDEGDIFCYLGIDRDSKLIISHLVGKRTAPNCLGLMKDLRSRVVGSPQLSTDGFMAYCGPEASVRKAFGSGVSYGIEVKQFGREEGPAGRYKPATCLGVKRASCIGSPNLATISTAKVERLNLSVRHFTKRFTRSTPCFSKTIQNHRHAIRLFIAHFNFCRPHSSLKKEVPRTPAMAAGLTTHPWTIEELLRFEN